MLVDVGKRTGNESVVDVAVDDLSVGYGLSATLVIWLVADGVKGDSDRSRSVGGMERVGDGGSADVRRFLVSGCGGLGTYARDWIEEKCFMSPRRLF